VSLSLFILTLVLFAYYLRARSLPHPRHVIAYFLVLGAVASFSAGFSLAIQEDGLGRFGRVVTGTVRERFSTTGEQGTRTIGPRGYWVTIRSSDDYQFFDMIARWVATGTSDLWAIDYSYPCEIARPCWQRTAVPRHRWLQMRAGQPVSVRYVKGGFGGARLEDQPLWAPAIARMAIGVVLAAAAALAWGADPALRRRRPVTTLAVVTQVEPVRYRGGSRWRVWFSYLDRDGNTHEASDEFATPAWKPGDTAVAKYEAENPKAAGLAAAELRTEN
jgi:hypothetical protein